MSASKRWPFLLTLACVFLVAACDDSRGTLATDLRTETSISDSDNTLIVTTADELVAALAPENAGRRILVRSGVYDIHQPLTVPDGVTLEGEGTMLTDNEGLPLGFGSDAHATLRMMTNVAGDVLTLGNGVTIRRLEIDDLTGRSGNVVAIYSRSPGDTVAANIVESEIVNANSTFYGLYMQTRNLNLGNAPAPHEGAELDVRMTKSLLRSSAGGRGVFAFNFAPQAKVALTLTGNVLGGITANGGVSLPDAVHDSEVQIESHGNIYRNEVSALCSPSAIGWNLTGGSGAPVPVAVSETSRNTLSMHSVGDRIDGFTTAVLGGGGRRYFGAPLAGPTNDNTLNLDLIGTALSTPSCGGATFIRDLDLKGAFSASSTLTPGNGNVLHAVIRNVTGSGSRYNFYADAGESSTPLPAATAGTGNRLEIVGNSASFARTNRNIDPAPDAVFFTGKSN
jgi:hypothetical protein